MVNYLEFRKSISSELIAVKDRVRNLIGGVHWGEEGRYKENVLMQVLRNYLPDSVRVGTGFVVSGEQCSTQIDIIVYSASITPFFKSGDFVIIEKSGVKGIIEVKTKLEKSQIKKVIKDAHKNGELIESQIFNGIFAYEADLHTTGNALPQSAIDALTHFKGKVNNIAFGSNIFMKYWASGEQRSNMTEHISFYDLPDLAIGYFISNLCEDASGVLLSSEQKEYYYPLEGGKEQKRIPQFEITFPQEQEDATNANTNS